MNSSVMVIFIVLVVAIAFIINDWPRNGGSGAV